MAGRYDSILETIGHTPVVRIQRLAPAGIDLYVKVEGSNPLGSVKDRLALGIIEDAERRGLLKPGQTVIEATSGNTGIGLAMVCAAKGYPLVVTMAENFSVERRKIMRFLGARVVLTPSTLRVSVPMASFVRSIQPPVALTTIFGCKVACSPLISSRTTTPSPAVSFWKAT